MSGRFLSFEGVDGAGKSSHIAALSDAFKMQGREVVCTREPGGTLLAEKLRNLILHDAMDPLTEALLVFAARRDHVQQVIVPALQRGAVVLCDRFVDATFAYQGYGRGFSLSVLSELERWVLDSQALGVQRELLPDLTLWFDLPVEVAAQRVAMARSPDRFEAQSPVFFQRVRDGYEARYRAAPERFAHIDAQHAPEQVWQQVLSALRSKGWLP